MATACIDVCDYEDYATVLCEKTRRARKDHRCGECGETIPAGALYLYEATLFDGSVSTHKTCARCWQVRRDYFNSFIWGGLVEAFWNTHGFDYRDGLPADFSPCNATPGEEA